MNYETWKKTYKRSEHFNDCMVGEHSEVALNKYFDETDFSFYLMDQQGYIPCCICHGLMFSVSGNATKYFRVMKKTLEMRYGIGTIDYIQGAADSTGHYICFFVEQKAYEKYRNEKLNKWR